MLRLELPGNHLQNKIIYLRVRGKLPTSGQAPCFPITEMYASIVPQKSLPAWRIVHPAQTQTTPLSSKRSPITRLCHIFFSNSISSGITRLTAHTNIPACHPTGSFKVIAIINWLDCKQFPRFFVRKADKNTLKSTPNYPARTLQ